MSSTPTLPPPFSPSLRCTLAVVPIFSPVLDCVDMLRLVVCRDLLGVCSFFLGDRHSYSIVVRGWGPFAEDDWTEVRVGGITMRTPKPCSRCQIPQINQGTLEVRSEPRKTMDTFR